MSGRTLLQKIARIRSCITLESPGVTIPAISVCTRTVPGTQKKTERRWRNLASFNSRPNEAWRITKARLRVSVRTCANPPCEIPNARVRKNPPSWRFTGRRVLYRGEMYGEIEIIRPGLNVGTGKYIRMSDMDGRRVQIDLRDVILSAPPAEGLASGGV